MVYTPGRASGRFQWLWKRAKALLSIQLFPYKLTHRELEARLEPGLVVLPGQILRFEGAEGVYGQIAEVRSGGDGKAGEGQVVRVRLLRGMPPLASIMVTLLQPGQMADEVARLLPPIEHPLNLDGFTGDYLRLGPLTLIEGQDFVRKYYALLALIQAVRPYQKILVIDPLGVFEPVGDVACYVAGEQVRLGLQQVNGKRFLEMFGGQFPEGVRKPVMETVAAHWPESGPFTGFSRLLTSGMITESLLKNLILQNCASVIRNKVFAETPEQVLDLSRLAASPMTALDLSQLQDPWKSYFYQEVVAQLFANPGWGLVPVLIHPENYLPDFGHWVQKADERQFHLLGLSSPYAKPAIRNLANNIVTVGATDAWTLQGELTLGLPIVVGKEPEPGLVPMPALEDEVAYPPIAYPPVEAPLPVIPEFEEIPQESASETEMGGESAPKMAELLVDEQDAEPEAVLATEEPAIVPEDAAELPSPPHQFFNSWQQEVLVEEDDTEPALSEPERSEPAADEGPDLGDVEEMEPLNIIPPTSSLFRTPVVDLSAPVVEDIPSFLTAEQLSELLNTPALELQTGPEPTMPSLPAVSDPLDYPDAEEGAIPEEMGSSSNFPEPPALTPAESAFIASVTHPVEPVLLTEPVTENEPDFSFPEAEKAPASLPNTPPEPVVVSPPPFPAPEEFEREEFSFDINLDQSGPGEASYEPTTSGDSEGGLGAEVARSLSEFEDLSRRPENPLLDFETADMAQKLAQPVEVVPQGPPPELIELPLPALEAAEPSAKEASVFSDTQAVEALPAMEPESKPESSEMQEALDLIFPRQFETPPEPQAEPEFALNPEEAPAPPAPIEDEVPVIHKKPEPVFEGLPAFKAGDKVRHPSYGLGVVKKVIPMDESVVLNITFENVGKRLLDPSLTELALESAG